MRKLKTLDIFRCTQCIEELGIKEEIRRVAMEAGTAADIFNRGFELLWALMELANRKGTQQKLYAFFAPIFEATEEEFENLDLNDLIAGFKQMSEENDLKVFFKSVENAMR